VYAIYRQINLDGFVKSPTAALRFISRHCGVPVSTPHSSRFASLAFGAFYFAVTILTFYEFINFFYIIEQKFTGQRKKMVLPFLLNISCV